MSCLDFCSSFLTQDPCHSSKKSTYIMIIVILLKIDLIVPFISPQISVVSIACGIKSSLVSIDNNLSHTASQSHPFHSDAASVNSPFPAHLYLFLCSSTVSPVGKISANLSHLFNREQNNLLWEAFLNILGQDYSLPAFCPLALYSLPATWHLPYI